MSWKWYTCTGIGTGTNCTVYMVYMLNKAKCFGHLRPSFQRQYILSYPIMCLTVKCNTYLFLYTYHCVDAVLEFKLHISQCQISIPCQPHAPTAAHGACASYVCVCLFVLPHHSCSHFPAAFKCLDQWSSANNCGSYKTAT